MTSERGIGMSTNQLIEPLLQHGTQSAMAKTRTRTTNIAPDSIGNSPILKIMKNH